MKKYVRTPKNEIFEIIYPNKNGKGAIYTVTKSFQRPYIEEYEHMKQADTIEELIECYVVICEHQDRPLIVFKNEIEHYKHCLVDKVKSNNRVLAIYGSIWVDGNLIKVARMNEKRELELL